MANFVHFHKLLATSVITSFTLLNCQVEADETHVKYNMPSPVQTDYMKA